MQAWDPKARQPRECRGHGAQGSATFSSGAQPHLTVRASHHPLRPRHQICPACVRSGRGCNGHRSRSDSLSFGILDVKAPSLASIGQNRANVLDTPVARAMPTYVRLWTWRFSIEARWPEQRNQLQGRCLRNKAQLLLSGCGANSRAHFLLPPMHQ